MSSLPRALRPSDEHAVLRRALEQRLLDHVDVEKLAQIATTLGEGARWGPMIDQLVAGGRLSDAQVHALLQEAGTPTLSGEEVSDHDTMSFVPGGSVEQGVAAQLEAMLREPFPAAWERYRYVRRIGQGGMGTVYEAFDPRLARPVAIKFIRGDNPRLAQRLLREARAQARIKHPAICDVYEAGEIDGRPFIAMRYVDGPPVDFAPLTLEEKVAVMRDAAEGLHDAHRNGVVHRDVKPSNVLVERGDDGVWRPQLVDFGLARDAESGQALTETGMLIGTPAYMSPEQARGDYQAIDRRTDVYSLGATLYHLLAGRPPFQGSPLSILTQVVSEDPPRLRRIAPRIPSDLETITLKCLEKDPARRYETARAVADDLQRYLDGDAISARPPSLRVRMARRVRRNPVAFAAVGIALLAAAVFLGAAVRARYAAAQQGVLARRYAADGQEIEGLLRRAYLLPAHDLRREKAVVRMRMDALRKSLAGARGPAAVAANYALGRGHLELREYEAARRHLEAAHEGDPGDAEIVLALGQAMGHLYRQKLEEAERAAVPEIRARERARAAAEFGDVARARLSEALGQRVLAAEEALFAEGEIALYEGRYDVAEAKGAEALALAPWLYEAKKLEGDLHLERGRRRSRAGDDDGARASYEQAGRAFAEAADIGRSDPEVALGEAARWIEFVEMERRRGESLRDAVDRALTACDRVLRLDPESASALNGRAHTLWRWAEYQDRHGEDPRPALARAAEAAEQARTFAEQEQSAAAQRESWDNLAHARRRRGEYDMRHGADASSSLSAAAEAVERALAIDPNDLSARNNLGLVQDALGLYQRNRGGDPLPSWARAAEAFTRVTELAPAYAGGYNNLGAVLGYEALYRLGRGQDPRPALEKTRAAYEAALRVNPKLANAHLGLGLSGITGGFHALRRGDPAARTLLEEAVRHMRVSLELKPDHAFALNNIGFACELRGREALERGDDPMPALREGRAALTSSIAVDPTDGYGYSNRALIAAVELRTPLSPAAADAVLAAGRRDSAKAREIDPRNPLFQWSAAELLRRAAERQAAAGRDPKPLVETALEDVARALSLDARNGDALAIQGSLQLLRARSAGNARRAQDAAAAVESLEQALRVNGLLVREYGPLLAEARKVAADSR